MPKIDGRSHTRLYRIYKGIKSRCGNKHSRYNTNGITMCDEWKFDFISFRTWSELNGYADYLTLDRIDNSIGYTPCNCRWVSQKVQQNNRTNNKKLEVDGKVKNLSEWCEIYNIGHTTVLRRLRNGWSDKDALTKPLMKNKFG